MILSHRTSVVIGTSAVVLALCVPAANAAKSPKVDSVEGTGSTSLATVTLKAHNEGATPEAPATGQFSAVSDALNLHGPVTCLHVSGHNAGLIYRVEPGSTPEALVGRDVFVTINDKGPGKTDKMAFLPPGTTPPGGGCTPSIMWDMDILDVTKGDFVVRDAEVATGGF